MEEVAYNTWAADPAAAFATGLGAADVVVEDGEEAVGPVKKLAVGTGGSRSHVVIFFMMSLS